MSYFEQLPEISWNIGVFSKIDDIKVELKRAIFESILTKSKVIEGADNDDEEEPNLSKVPGGSEPSEKAQTGDFEESYSSVTF